MSKSNLAQQKVGTVINGYKIVEIVGYNEALVECVKCGNVASKFISNIEKTMIRCWSCNPSMKDLYISDIRDLAQLGMEPNEIAKTLGCATAIVYPLLNVLRNSGELDSLGAEYEYDFKEIAEALGISEHLVKQSYSSALRKIKCVLEPTIGNYSDSYTETPEQAQTA